MIGFVTGALAGVAAHERGVYYVAEGRGNHGDEPEAPEADADPAAEVEEEGSGRIPGLPDLMRRALSLGLSGFFMTEETIRKALGDTLPKDWTDFAADQSERTRTEFLERLSFEIGRALEKIDVAAVLRDLLEGRTLEVKAEIRLGSKTPGPGSHKIQVAARGRGKKR